MIEKTPEEKIIMQSSSFDKSAHPYNIQVLNLFDKYLQPIHSKLVIKSKLKDLLGKLKMLKVHNI